MTLELLDGEFAVAKLDDFSEINWQNPFVFVARTDDEYSLVCPVELLPAHCRTVSAGWRGLRVAGQLDFALTGVLAGIANVLAAQISIFAVSTFNTDYILVRSDKLIRAVQALKLAGYNLSFSALKLNIRRFSEDDAGAVAELIRRNFREVNCRDYPADEMVRLQAYYSPEKIIDLARSGLFFVTCSGQSVIGSGLAGPLTDHAGEYELQAIFVNPDWQGCGAGKMMIDYLEQSCCQQGAHKIVLDASITAAGFYENLGFAYSGGQPSLDENGLYRMEKILL